jgi:GR25 family glycosyltransferase involved in LPS biosynthesis
MEKLAFVINLDQYPEKWHSTKRILEKAGFTNVRRMEAVYGKDIPDLKVAGVSATSRLMIKHPYFKNSARQLNSIGAVGGALSHMKCWKHILDHGLSGAFIFEDDVVPLPGLKRGLEKWFSQGKSDTTMFWFGHNGLGDDLAIRGAHGYYCPRSVAEILLNNRTPIFEPTDIYISDMGTMGDIPVDIAPRSLATFRGNPESTIAPGIPNDCFKCNIPALQVQFDRKYRLRKKSAWSEAFARLIGG